MIHCVKCDICVNNNAKGISGVGPKPNYIMFVGSNPDYKSKRLASPFVGIGSLMFSKLLYLFGFNRSMVYLTYAVKCKTPENRKPTLIEINNCRPHLFNEIEQVNPKIVVLFGSIAIASYIDLYNKPKVFKLANVNARYDVDNNRVIVYSKYDFHMVRDQKSKESIVEVFKTIVTLYRVRHRWHNVNFNE